MKKTLSIYALAAILAVCLSSIGTAKAFVPATTDSNNAFFTGADANLGSSGSDSNLGSSGSDANTGKSGSDSNTGGSFMLQNPLDPKFNTVGGLINGALDIFTYLVILFAVLMIIYVGLRFVMARGNTEELKERKDQLLYLMIGVAIVVGARLLVSVVLNTLQATGVVQPGVINSGLNAINGQ